MKRTAMTLALAAIALIGSAHAQVQVQRTGIAHQTGCGAIASASYAIQMSGQLGQSASLHFVTGVWTFAADGSGFGADSYLMPPAPGSQSRAYNIACAAAADGTLILTTTNARNGTLNVDDAWQVEVAAGGAEFYVMSSGANGFRMAGRGVRQ